MDLKKISELDWIKRWNEPFSLLGCSYFGEQYIHSAEKRFGVGFNHLLFAYHDGITVCYRLQSDTEAVGKRLASIFLGKENSAEIWKDELISATDKIMKTIEQPLAWFTDPEHFRQFEQQYFDYMPVYIRVNIVPDFLPAEILEKSLPALREARFYAEHAYIKIDKRTQELMQLLLKNEGYPEELTHLFHFEVRKYLKTKELPPREELQKRHHLFGLYTNREGMHELERQKIAEFEEHIAQKNTTQGSELKGVAASPGRVQGTVRLVFDPHKAGSFNEGDILVTSMTNPEFLPLMKKSGAIIAEGGGVLSHAAIASRELGKPCLLYVQGATQALKDGDMVEVDAEKGVVKILYKK